MSRFQPLLLTTAITVAVTLVPNGPSLQAQAQTATPKANLKAEAGDSPRVRCTWTDVPKAGLGYAVIRMDAATATTAATNPVIIRVAPGIFSVEDLTPKRQRYTYELHYWDYTKDADNGFVDAGSAPVAVTIDATTGFPAARIAQICDDKSPIDTARWLRLGGSWNRDVSGAITQLDDSQQTDQNSKKLIRLLPTIDLSTLTAGAEKMQVRASVVLSGWDKLVAASGGLSKTPTFAVGVGFSTQASRWTSGYYVVFYGDASGKLVNVEDGNGSKSPFRSQTNTVFSNWKDGKKFWMQLQIEHKTTFIAISGKIWDDTQAESEAVRVGIQDSQGLPWPNATAPAVLQLQPALYGGIQGDSGRLTLSFSDFCVEMFTSTAPTVAAIRPAAPLLPGTPKPLAPPPLNQCVCIPSVAITTVGISHWGTLLGRVEPESPIRVEVCPPADCRWTVPTASKPACCSYSGAFAGAGVTWSAPINGTIVETEAVQVLAPLESVDQGGADFAPSITPSIPGFLPLIPTEPAQGRNHPRLHRRIQKTGGTPLRDTKIRRISFTSDDDITADTGEPVLAAPSAAPPRVPSPTETNPGLKAETVTPGNPAAAAKLKSQRQQLVPPLATVPMTRRELRDFGAIATLPYRKKEAQDALDQKERECADQMIRMLLIRAFEDGMKPGAPVDDTKKSMLEKLKQTSELTPAVALLRTGTSPNLDTLVRATRRYVTSDLTGDFQKTVEKRIDSLFGSLGTERFAAFPVFRWPPTPAATPGPEAVQGPQDQGFGDPFDMLPCTKVVPMCPPGASSIYATSSRYKDPETQGPPEPLFKSSDAQVWTYHFDHPARFPATKFGPNCCGFEGEGAVIHEGMRLLAHQDGRYEVRFNVTAPSIPVQLRLQLILFQEKEKLPEQCPEGSPVRVPIPRTLTLAPILLRPDPNDSKSFPNDLEGGTYPSSYWVSVQGYSQVIKETQGSEEGTGHFLLVKRIGTARMGAGVLYQVN